MSYTGRNPFAAPSSERAVRIPASGPERPPAAAMAGSAARTSAGSRRSAAVSAAKAPPFAASGSSPYEEMPDVLEAAGPREVDGRVLPVVVEALLTADVTDPGVGDDDTGEPSRRFEKSGC